MDAAASIAETLVEIGGKGYAHRDIKPGNLYSYERGWALGDFGLVQYPEKEPITSEKLGPRYFVAPEMLSGTAVANGMNADIYLCAKTLWVLATGQHFAPPGQHIPGGLGMTIGDFVAHEKADMFNAVIEKSFCRHFGRNRGKYSSAVGRMSPMEVVLG